MLECVADIFLINPKFQVSYWGLEHALPLFGKRVNLPVACLPLIAALTPAEHSITIVDEQPRQSHERSAFAAKQLDDQLFGGIADDFTLLTRNGNRRKKRWQERCPERERSRGHQTQLSKIAIARQTSDTLTWVT